MKQSKIAIALLAAANSVALVTATHAADQGAFFGSDSDIEFADTLWRSLEQNRLVGNDAINVYPFQGNEPHGAIQQVLDDDIEVDGRKARVIVKRNHGGKDITVKSVYADPVSSLKAVTVMFKRETGYDRENLDWF